MAERFGERARGERCYTCGRPRGLEQLRNSWGIHPTPFVPSADDGREAPSDLSCSVSIYRNGGTHERTHLCNECLRVGLRVIKVQVSKLLVELDADHDKDAEIAELTKRLASLQHRHYRVCFDHNRMQERLGDLLARPADPEVVRMAEFEAGRGRAEEPAP